MTALNACMGTAGKNALVKSFKWHIQAFHLAAALLTR